MRKNPFFSFLLSFFHREISKRETLRPARRNSGQAMAEYILIIALISLAGLGITRFFGEALASAYEGLCMFMAVPLP